MKFKIGNKRKKEGNPIETMKRDRSRLLDQNSDFYITEAYKSLRTNVMFSLTGDSQSKVVMITSSMQGEGKSITAANLAISFAQADKKTLLIDCDMRRPKLSRLMNMQSGTGLSNVLMEPELLEKALIQTKTENLSIVLAGDIPPNPSELLGSQRMQNLLNRLREQFDYIILDTPPINVVTDAMVLCPFTDGALFVVRSGRAERGAVLRATEQLEYADAKILGFVLNDVKNNNSSYGKYRRGGYGSKGYGYGYGYQTDQGGAT